MATQLVYLEDFDVITCSASVTAVDTTEDGRVDIQLNRTCFYPCGGTHIQDVRDVGVITITKVKTKKGLTKVSYAVEGIN
ncbi:MAG TPA: hypothetical protein VJP80_05135 [Candidatus Saccharimonadales bacterium]|nr:hypothetical protein [Candidatus Saccharimonadales bacterium]